MARGLNGSTQYLEYNGIPVSGYPLAMACQFRAANITADHSLMAIADTGSDTDYIWLSARGTVTGDPIYFQQRRSGTSFAKTTSGFSANTDHRAGGIAATDYDRRALLDAGNKGTDTTYIAYPLSTDKTTLGVLHRTGFYGYLAGSIFEAAVFDLSGYPGATNSDKADWWEAHVWAPFAAGWSLEHFPLGRVAYWPLGGLRSKNDNDWYRAYDMTPYNSPTWVDSPGGIIYPTPVLFCQPTEAGGAATVQGAISEGIKASDVLTASLRALASTSDGVKLGDTQAAEATLRAAISEGLKLGESWAAELIALTSIADGVLAGDSFAVTLQGLVSMAEGTVAGDVFAASVIGLAAISEGVKLGGAFAGTVLNLSTIAEGLTAGDTLTAILTGRATTAEGIKAGDTLAARLTGRPTLTEGALFGDSLLGRLTGRAVLADGAVLGDTFLAGLLFSGAIFEGITLGDSFAAELSALVAGPYRSAAGQVCSPGTVVGQVFAPGRAAGQVYSAGVVAGQIVA